MEVWHRRNYTSLDTRFHNDFLVIKQNLIKYPSIIFKKFGFSFFTIKFVKCQFNLIKLIEKKKYYSLYLT